MTQNIYLDHAATTPIDTRVYEAMRPYYTESYGNASSSHRYGQRAEQAIENARETIAKTLNCTTQEIIFTSGGSESSNLAIRGAAWAARQTGKGQHLTATTIEHEATSKTITQLSTVMGFSRSLVKVNSYGQVNTQELESAIQPDTTLFSCIYASNEVGSIQPIPSLSDKCHKHNVLIHTDAVQAAGQLLLNVKTLDIDLMSISGHKFYGPKGIGILFVRDGVDLLPTQTGGSHEGTRRAGTQNTPLIIGLAKALEIAYAELDQHTTHYRNLRDQLIHGILDRIPGAQLSGHPEQRLPSHASFVFDGIDSNTLLMHLDMNGIAASSGSACKTGNPEPSTVLLAMGYSESQARGGLRLTVGRQNTEDDITYTIDTLATIIEKLYRLTPT